MKKTQQWLAVLLLTGLSFGKQPLQVTVTSTFNLTSSAALAWNASTGAASYNVLRGPTGGPYTKITQDGTVTTTVYVDSQAPKGQNCYVVQAVNGNGTSSNSAEACGTIP